MSANIRQLVDFANALVGVTVKALTKMGLSIPLIWNEMADSITEDGVIGFLKDAGLTIEGTDVKSITEDFAKKIKEVGYCQRANIVEVSDDKVVMDLGECILAPATKSIRGTDVNFITPCPMMAILYGVIEAKTGKKGFIEKSEWKPEENTTIMTLKLEE